MSLDAAGLLEERNFSISAADQARHHLSTRVLPLGEFLSGNSVGVLSSIQSPDQGGSLDIAAANVIGPRRQSSELVVVKLDGVLDVFANARGEGLDIGLEQLGGGGLSEREAIRYLRAALSLAKMAVSHSRQSNRIRGGPRHKALKLLNQRHSSGIDRRRRAGTTATRAALGREYSRMSGLDIVVGNVAAVLRLVPHIGSFDGGSSGLARNLDFGSFGVGTDYAGGSAGRGPAVQVGFHWVGRCETDESCGEEGEGVHYVWFGRELEMC